MTITVLGATGGQGGTVTEALLTGGSPVRAMVRNVEDDRARALAAEGVDVVEGDLSDVASLSRAFKNATAAFAVTTPFTSGGVEAEVEQGTAIIEAALDADLPFLVMASVASADRATGIPHFESKARIEEMLVARGDLAATIVAPTYFYDNLLSGVDDIAVGRLPMPMPADVPLQQVSRRDLGLVVAAVLADPERWAGARVEVAGDELTVRQMAEVMTEVVGWPVEYVEVPLGQVGKASADVAAMFDYLGSTGYQVDLSGLRAAFPGIDWLSFRQWAERRSWPAQRQ